MSTIAVLTTPNSDQAPDSAPRRIVSAFPSIAIEVIQFRQDAATAIPYFWVEGVTGGAFEAAVKDDPRLSGLQRLEHADNRMFYKVRWAVDSPLISCSADSGGVVMQAYGNSDEWQLIVMFETGQAASAFQRCCNERDIPLSIDQVSSLSEMTETELGSVTQPQRELLQLAYDDGYFEVPRAVSQRDLASELDISSSAVGARLRRGLENLIEETVIE